MTDLVTQVLIVLLVVATVWRIRLMAMEESRLSAVYRMLRVWAEHWGEPAENIKPLLLEALQERRRGWWG